MDFALGAVKTWRPSYSSYISSAALASLYLMRATDKPKEKKIQHRSDSNISTMAVTVPPKTEEVKSRGSFKEIFTGPHAYDRKTEEEGTEDQPRASVRTSSCGRL